MTSRQYGKRAIFVSGDVRFQDGDAVVLGKLRGTAFSRLLLSFNVCTLGVVIMYTHRTTVLLWYNGLCDIRLLVMYDACYYAWHIAPIRFNNVRLCPSIFMSSISGLLRRPRVLNPARRLASLMR